MKHYSTPTQSRQDTQNKVEELMKVFNQLSREKQTELLNKALELKNKAMELKKRD